MAATAAIPLFTSYEGPISVWLLVNTALALYLISAFNQGRLLAWLTALVIAAALLGFYLIGKLLLGNLTPDLPHAMMLDAMDIWLMMLFILLFVLTVQIRLFPQARGTQTLYRWLFSGLYLDEMMTRVTLQLWPVVLRPQPYETQAGTSFREELRA